MNDVYFAHISWLHTCDSYTIVGQSFHWHEHKCSKPLDPKKPYAIVELINLFENRAHLCSLKTCEGIDWSNSIEIVFYLAWQSFKTNKTNYCHSQEALVVFLLITFWLIIQSNTTSPVVRNWTSHWYKYHVGMITHSAVTEIIQKQISHIYGIVDKC